MCKWRQYSAILLAATSLITAVNAHAAKNLHIYNWSDYIAADTISRFENSTGIKVTYDVYDSNEVLEAKLLAGKSGYDLIFPTARPFGDRHIKANLYQQLDKSKLDKLSNLDEDILKSLEDIDPGNQYMLPYMWGTTGIGINLKKVKAILGDNVRLDSWNLLFNPEIVSKLAACGVSMMDDPTEVIIAARAFLGKDTSDYSSEALAEAAAAINKVRPSIRYFSSSQYINDLANGDSCVAQGYSGDILQARDRARESKNGVEVVYLIPHEGAVVWTDVMAIPKDAPNLAEAHQFINFLLDPAVIAPISNFVAYANANKAATPLVDEAIRTDPGIYPTAETRKNFIVIRTPNQKEARNLSRTWTRIKTGQ